KGREYARERGIVIADTKFEFGLLDGRLLLIDECLTPDSSRFWPASEVKPGGNPTSFDKQYLRDWLTSTGWNRTPPPPKLPADGARRRDQQDGGHLPRHPAPPLRHLTLPHVHRDLLHWHLRRAPPRRLRARLRLGSAGARGRVHRPAGARHRLPRPCAQRAP